MTFLIYIKSFHLFHHVGYYLHIFLITCFSSIILLGECRCTNIEIPEVYVEGYYIMTVWGFKEDQSLIFSKTIDDLKIVNKNTLTFIQTDKYMYVPGQTGNRNHCVKLCFCSFSFEID